MERHALQTWTVFPLPMEDLSGIDWQPVSGNSGRESAGAVAMGSAGAARQLQGTLSAEVGLLQRSAASSQGFAPTLYRGSFNASAELLGLVAGEEPHLPDTFLRMPGFTKGVAFVNGFNLGWYWPAVGPQLTMYIPGPVLRVGVNSLVLLEMEGAPNALAVDLVEEPDFHFHAARQSQRAAAQQPSMDDRRLAHQLAYMLNRA